MIPGHEEDGRSSWWQKPRHPSYNLEKSYLSVSVVDCLGCERNAMGTYAKTEFHSSGPGESRRHEVYYLLRAVLCLQEVTQWLCPCDLITS